MILRDGTADRRPRGRALAAALALVTLAAVGTTLRLGAIGPTPEATPAAAGVPATGDKAVTGTVLRPDGKPAANVAYRLASRRGAKRLDAAGRTDTAGKFRAAVFASEDSALWVVPDDLAPLRLPLPDVPAGDLGELKLSQGTGVSGRALDEGGTPAEGVRLLLGQRVAEEADGLVDADPAARSATTDQNGAFEFGPVSPGRYTLSQAEPGRDGSLFLPRTVFVKARPGPGVELRAVPYVTVRGRTVDARGKPRRGTPVTVSGQVAGIDWSRTVWPDASGAFSVVAPEGLTPARVSALLEVKKTALWRRSRRDQFVQPQDGGTLDLAKLTDDLPSLEVMVYELPTLDVVCRFADGRPANVDAITAEYASGVLPGVRLDIGVTSVQEKGRDVPGRFRCYGLLPDQELTLRTSHEGRPFPPLTLTLAEGEAREVTLTLPAEGGK